MTGLTRNWHKASTKSGSQARSVDAAHTANAQGRPPRRAALALISKPRTWIAASVAGAIVVFGGFASWFLVSGARNAPANTAAGSAAAATFVGSKTCASCHEAEAKLWRTSQHKLAMDHATEKSVLGNFSDVTFSYFDVQSRFFRNGEKYFVETDGPDGKLATFEIKYTFGVDPLQQYLVEFPDGRLQAFSIAWDTRPKDLGGQRWFHLYPKENIRSDDVLHWTKLNQNWNFMCSECHSTGVKKNYDAGQNRFATAWTEISVGCEACHGKGSSHVAWARDKAKWWKFGKADDPAKGLDVAFDERRNAVWRREGDILKRSVAPATLRKEVETCGLCHARRGQISEDWHPGRSLSETHLVTPITRGLYSADGQMRHDEETYNYIPFKQSAMFAAGGCAAWKGAVPHTP